MSVANKKMSMQVQIPVLVINLDARQDRWKQVSENLRFACKEITRVSGLQGKKLKTLDIPISFRAKSSLQKHVPLQFSIDSWGAVGCFLSHMKAWQSIVKRNQACIVLEDDVKIENGSLPDLYSENFLWLQVFRNHKNITIVPGWTETHSASMYGAHAYYMTPAAAQKALQSFREIDLAVDYYLQAVFPFAKNTPIFSTFKSNSDIEHPEKKLFSNTLIFVLLFLICFVLSYSLYTKCKR